MNQISQINSIVKYTLLAVLLILSSAPVTAASSSNLLIIRSGDTPAYLAVERGFRAQLSRDYLGSQEGIQGRQLPSIQSHDIKSADKLENLLSTVSKHNTDLIITIGARAAYDVLKVSPDIAILSVFIPRKTYHSIMDEVSNGVKGENRSAIYLDQPDERLVLLAKSVTSANSKVSLLSGSSEEGLLKARHCAGNHISTLMGDVNVYRKAVSSRSLKRTLKRSDIIIATPELVKQSPNAIKWMLYMAYQRNIPVVGYSQAFVDAGAITAVFSTPEDIGRQAAEIFSSLVSNAGRGDNLKLKDSMYPSYFQVSVNQNVADALGYAKLDEVALSKTLTKSALNCQENYVPLPSNGVKQQMTRR